MKRLAMMYPCFMTPLINELRGGDFHMMRRSDIQVSALLSPCLLNNIELK